MSETSSEKELLSIITSLESEMETLHRYHIQKAKKIAHTIKPGLTEEDLLNPDNFPEVVQDPAFTYEDGTASGVLSAKILVLNFFKEYLKGKQ
jgi:hypothetical protein